MPRNPISFVNWRWLIFFNSNWFLTVAKKPLPRSSEIKPSSWLRKTLRYGFPQIAPSRYSSVPRLIPLTLSIPFPVFGHIDSFRRAGYGRPVIDMPAYRPSSHPRVFHRSIDQLESWKPGLLGTVSF